MVIVIGFRCILLGFVPQPNLRIGTLANQNLGLNFDPDKELKKREEERAKLPLSSHSETDEIEKIRQQLQRGEI